MCYRSIIEYGGIIVNVLESIYEGVSDIFGGAGFDILWQSVL